MIGKAQFQIVCPPTCHDNMAELDFRREKLGILNWGPSRKVWEGIDFHLIPPEDRPEYLDLAVQRFEDMFNDSPTHLLYTDGRVRFRVDKGRTMGKLRQVQGENERGRLYAFVDINMKKDPERYGGMMKPASWKAPEPKKYVRAHLFAEDPLRGAGWYGPDYMTGGGKTEDEKQLRDNWFRHKFAQEFRWGV